MEIKVLRPSKQSPVNNSQSVARNLPRSAPSNGYRELSTNDGLNQGKLYAPPKPAHEESKVVPNRHKERAPPASQDVSEGEESEEDEKGTARAGLAAGKMQENENAYGWAMGKSVLQVSKGVAADLRGSLLQVKEMLIDKLAAVPIPADTLEHARHSMESIIREATHTAYGKTKDAMQRIRLRLVEIIPSLSPSETKKIVDDVEREVLDNSEAASGQSSSQSVKHQAENSNRGVTASAASAVSSNQTSTASILSMNMDRIKSWAMFRSRL